MDVAIAHPNVRLYNWTSAPGQGVQGQLHAAATSPAPLGAGLELGLRVETVHVVMAEQVVSISLSRSGSSMAASRPGSSLSKAESVGTKTVTPSRSSPILLPGKSQISSQERLSPVDIVRSTRSWNLLNCGSRRVSQRCSSLPMPRRSGSDRSGFLPPRKRSRSSIRPTCQHRYQQACNRQQSIHLTPPIAGWLRSLTVGRCLRLGALFDIEGVEDGPGCRRRLRRRLSTDDHQHVKVPVLVGEPDPASEPDVTSFLG